MIVKMLFKQFYLKLDIFQKKNLLGIIGIVISEGPCSVKLDPFPGLVSKLENLEGLFNYKDHLNYFYK